MGPSGSSRDSFGPVPIGLGAAVDLFCAAKAAEGASPRTVEWYQMILIRVVRRFGEARPVDAIPAAELRAWLLELRASLAPESIAGYVRGLKAFGNWCAAEEVAAAGFRGLRRPKVPHRLIAPFSDPALRSLLALADERERALALVLLDTGLRLSELASLRVGDVRPDGTLHVMGKGAKERIVPIGASARRALVRYLGTRSVNAAGDPLFCGRWGSGLTARGIQLAIARLGRRAAVGTRCSPHTFRHTFARGYLVNGGDVFSLQQILGHTTLDMVRRYVYYASFETVRRLHAAASPADGLLIGPRVSLFVPRAWASVLEDLAEASRVMVQDVIREAIARLLAMVVPDRELTPLGA